MAYDARTIANDLLQMAKERGHALTNMQLQKLVYIAHGYSLAILNKPLIKQRVEAWRYGPVIPDLYHELRQYGAGVVTDPVDNAPKDTVDETDHSLLATVLNAYGRYSGSQLSTMTHQKDSPWSETFSNGYFNNDDIDDDKIKAYYKRLLNERAPIQPAQ